MTENTLNDLYSSAQTHQQKAETYTASADKSGPHTKRGKFYRREAGELTAQAEYEQDLQVYFVNLENVKQKFENYYSVLGKSDGKTDDLHERVVMDSYKKLVDEASLLLKKHPQAIEVINKTLFDTFESLYYLRTEVGNTFQAREIAYYMMDKGIPGCADKVWRAEIGQIFSFIENAIVIENGKYPHLPPEECVTWWEDALTEAGELLATYDRNSGELKKVGYLKEWRRERIKEIIRRIWETLKKKKQEYPGAGNSIGFDRRYLKQVLSVN